MYKIIHSQFYFRIILSILAIRLSTTLHIRGELSRECNYFKNNSESIRTACFADSNLASGGKNRIQNREFHISSKFDFGEKERKLRLFVVSAANAKRARTKGAEWRTTREWPRNLAAQYLAPHTPITLIISPPFTRLFQRSVSIEKNASF